MKKRLSLLTITLLFSCILVFAFTGCSKAHTQLSDSQKLSLEPKQVVENYFKYWNEKNSKGVLSTLTERYSKYNMNWEFENLKSVKLNSIVEESNTELEVDI